MKTIETRIDNDLAEIGVKAHIYHIRSYGEGSQRKKIRMFNAITIADNRHLSARQVENDVGEAIDTLKSKIMPISYRRHHHQATWIMTYLKDMGYNGIAICDKRDNFSRKLGRIISEGRLLKYLVARKEGILWD